MPAALRRSGVIAAVVLFGAVLTGCMHVAENSTVSADGHSTEVLTMTFSPALMSLLHVSNAQMVKQEMSQFKKKPFPGQVSMSHYTDSSGWKGLKIVVKLANLGVLEKLETTAPKGSSPTFATFGISHRGSLWHLQAKVNTGSFSKSLIPLRQMEAMGLTDVFSFKLPGRVISDNATSKGPGGVLSWNMLKRLKVIRATWST